jgi:hypothetical protein
VPRRIRNESSVPRSRRAFSPPASTIKCWPEKRENPAPATQGPHVRHGEWVGCCSVGPSPKDAGFAELEVKSPSIGQTRFSGLETPGGATSRHFWRFRPSVGFHVFGPCPIGGGATERRRLGLFANIAPTAARWLRGRLLVRGAVTVRLLPQDSAEVFRVFTDYPFCIVQFAPHRERNLTRWKTRRFCIAAAMPFLPHRSRLR